MTGLKMGLRSNYRTRSAVWDLNLSETKTFQNLKGWRRDSIPGRFMTKCLLKCQSQEWFSAWLDCFVLFILGPDSTEQDEGHCKKKQKTFCSDFFPQKWCAKSEYWAKQSSQWFYSSSVLLLSDLSSLHQLVYDTFAGIPFILSNPPPLFLFLVTVISVTR